MVPSTLESVASLNPACLRSPASSMVALATGVSYGKESEAVAGLDQKTMFAHGASHPCSEGHWIRGVAFMMAASQESSASARALTVFEPVWRELAVANRVLNILRARRSSLGRRAGDHGRGPRNPTAARRSAHRDDSTRQADVGAAIAVPVFGSIRAYAGASLSLDGGWRARSSVRCRSRGRHLRVQP
jgi:hypothetical protein